MCPKNIYISHIEGSGALTKIRGAYPHLSQSNQKLADYILDHPGDVIEMTVTSLAERCEVGEATIIRFCQYLGFKGFQDLKLSLAKDLVTPLSNIDQNIDPSDNMETIAQKLTYRCGTVLEETLKVLDMDKVQKTIDLLVSSRRILFFGVGASGLSALEAKYRFLRIGINCDALSDPHYASMSAATLEDKDLFMGFSHSGSTKDVVECTGIAKESGAKTVVVTSFPKSPITRYSDIVLLTAAPETPLTGGSYWAKFSQLFVINMFFVGVALKLESKGLEANVKTASAVLNKLY